MTYSILAKSICEDPELIKKIAAKFNIPLANFAEPQQCESLDYLSSFAQHSKGMVIGHQNIDGPFLKTFPNLKVIAKYGVGLDNIQFDACRQAGVEVLYRAGVNSRYVAEHTLGLILTLLRRIAISDREIRQQIWKRNGGTSLFGKTIGIVGFGFVGQALADLLQSFKVKILICDILEKQDVAKEFGATQVSLETLLARSDIISMHVPLTHLTANMCNEIFFSQMKPGAVFLNTSRGAICDLEALSKALQATRIFAAGCDVFPVEPPPAHPLFSLDNFLSTPHIAANCSEAKEAMAYAACEEIAAYLGQ